uniref:NAD(P)H-quinone oxidoreductase subunit O, organellar chromatophore n=1 Tax=Paulinella chromatophora TaxID=39717 RepID=NDHO_PAUCH|nr:hypothetical protein PCC_0297 [Paulinella chromatophora]B1X470.1 RecName: Full=NAD(P)H-quinone oxidoreductase subunit O, organellar chromatophore; AltName: Full=NAD(P)H dehydrogenase I subunit O; AltName: Full=NDH-1 subunit O; AltName: Full=NDH-O [Paulinella chromatophora]ACB42739.1 hypothetical protein PCC_0297 [Paulinella chromatophora]
MNEFQTESFVSLKPYDLVKVNRGAYVGSLEARASDPIPPAYIFEGPGTLITTAGQYSLVRWHLIPAPDVWLATAQLEAYSED